jgi:hypothetical protein
MTISMTRESAIGSRLSPGGPSLIMKRTTARAVQIVDMILKIRVVRDCNCSSFALSCGLSFDIDLVLPTQVALICSYALSYGSIGGAVNTVGERHQGYMRGQRFERCASSGEVECDEQVEDVCDLE